MQYHLHMKVYFRIKLKHVYEVGHTPLGTINDKDTFVKISDTFYFVLFYQMLKTLTTYDNLSKFNK